MSGPSSPSSSWLDRSALLYASSTSFGDPRAFMQGRVALYAGVLFAILGSLYLLELLVNALGRPDLLLAVHLSGAKLGHLAVSLLLGLAWALVRRGERSATTLAATETFGTVLLCTVVALMSLVLPTLVPRHIVSPIASLFVALALVVRASVVPSSARHTAIVGFLSCIPAIVVAGYTYDGPVADLGVPGAVLGSAIPVVMTLMFVPATAVTSMVIFGLRARVQEAMQLGQYTLEEKIGEGGMGSVYRARHALLRRPTAVKLLPPEKAGQNAITRFEREVQQTSRLSHPNTVAIYDFGHTPEGVFYYAMEYLEGLSLEQLVELDGPVPPARAIHILAQVADALAEAHGAGLIHRDVKPANIILCNRGGIADIAKVVDFGLVKDIEGADVGVTAAGTITGTPLYLAPEQLVSPDEVDGRTDLYALGAVGYFLLTGVPVFEGRSVVQICAHHLHTAPTTPSERLGEPLPNDLQELILRCLAKKPDDRPESAQALRIALLDCQDARGWERADASAWWAARADVLATRRRDRAAAASTGPGAFTIAMRARR